MNKFCFLVCFLFFNQSLVCAPRFERFFENVEAIEWLEDNFTPGLMAIGVSEKENNKILIMDGQTLATLQAIKCEAAVRDAVFNHDGSLFAVVFYSGLVQIRSFETGLCVQDLGSVGYDDCRVVFSVDGKYLKVEFSAKTVVWRQVEASVESQFQDSGVQITKARRHFCCSCLQ
jgi:hypothetical protein